MLLKTREIKVKNIWQRELGGVSFDGFVAGVRDFSGEIRL
jgi:hypothetical protein